MTTISKPNTFSANTTIASSEINANFDTIYNDYNGSISAVNLASGAVTTAKIADSNVTTAKVANDAITATKIDWSAFSNNIKSATNTSAPTLSNTSQDLASCGLSLSFTCSGTAYALVTVSLGIVSAADFEFKPEIRLGGTIQKLFGPNASTGAGRGVVRGFTYLVTLANGSNTLSAGVNISSGTSLSMQIGAGNIAAIVFGEVTA